MRTPRERRAATAAPPAGERSTMMWDYPARHSLRCMVLIFNFFKDFDLSTSCTLCFNAGVPCIKSDGRVRNCDRCQGMKRACYWAPDQRPTRKVRRRWEKKSHKKVGTSDEESEAVSTGGEQWPCKRAWHTAGDAIRGPLEARGLDT